MRNLKIGVVSFAFLALSVSAGAEERLNGKWKSSLPLTKSFYEQFAKLSTEQKELVDQLFGLMEVEYHVTESCVYIPAVAMVIGGKKYDGEEVRNCNPYKVIFSGENDVVVTTEIDGTKQVSTLHFVDENTYWIYVGSSGAIEGLNIREYFVRLPPNHSLQGRRP